MKKSLLALGAVAALGGLGFSGAAHAVWVVGDINNAAATKLAPADTGVGHILVTPYFSTVGAEGQPSNTTLLSVVNTDTVNGKAVKVRFRGAANSDDVFDFTVLLSPYDVWTASVSQGENGRSVIKTSDTTCTLPAQMPEEGLEFDPLRLPEELSEGAKGAHTQEGYVEWLNMADIRPGTPLFKQIKHGVTTPGKPDCDPDFINYLTAASDANVPAGYDGAVKNAALTETEASAFGLTQPTGGLMGNWTIYNNANVTSYGGPHSAIAATNDDGVPAAARLFFAPQIGDNDIYFPDGTSATQPAIWSSASDKNLSETADPLLTNAANGGEATPRLSMMPFDLPDLSTPYVKVASGAIPPAPMQAVTLSDALATTTLMNEWTAATSANGTEFGTDWVFSQPTRRYHVVVDYATGTKVHNSQTKHLFYLEGGMQLQTEATYGDMVCLKAGQIKADIFDREEGKNTVQTSGGQWSPGRPSDPARGFCGEVAVMQFGTSENARALSGQLTPEWVKLPTGFGAGWMSYTFKDSVAPRGLPVIGYAANTFKGSNGANVGNFGDAVTHRYVRAAAAPVSAPPAVTP